MQTRPFTHATWLVRSGDGGTATYLRCCDILLTDRSQVCEVPTAPETPRAAPVELSEDSRPLSPLTPLNSPDKTLEDTDGAIFSPAEEKDDDVISISDSDDEETSIATDLLKPLNRAYVEIKRDSSRLKGSRSGSSIMRSVCCPSSLYWCLSC